VYLLDTNIVSRLDPRRHASAPALVAWLARNGAYLFLSALTFLELEAGILKLRREGKRERADELASLARAILTDFGERVLAVDAEVALEAARRLGESRHAPDRQPVARTPAFRQTRASRRADSRSERP